MCEYCEGVEGKVMAVSDYFGAVVEPYHMQLRVEYRCALCDVWDKDYVPVNFCPMCGSDLRGGDHD